MKLDEAVERIAIHLGKRFLRLRKLPRPYPARLFHYTSQKGLLGIIESGVVWATNVLYLNDSSELTYGLSQVAEILTGLSSKNSLGLVKHSTSVATFVKKAHDLLNMSVLLPDKHFYAFCFCKHPDLLSQWRAYSAGGGYAIGFDTDPLGRALITQLFSLFPVDYGPGESLKLCDADLRSVCKALDRCIDELPTDEEVLLAGAAEWLKIVLVSHVAWMKHPGFAEEDEWRILVTLPSDNLSDVGFREGRDAFIPYYKANVSDLNTKKLPIREIVIGPTLHPKLAEQALDSLLKKNGYPDVLITHSEIPFVPRT